MCIKEIEEITTDYLLYLGEYKPVKKPTLLLDCYNGHAMVVGPRDESFGSK